MVPFESSTVVNKMHMDKSVWRLLRLCRWVATVAATFLVIIIFCSWLHKWHADLIPPPVKPGQWREFFTLFAKTNTIVFMIVTACNKWCLPNRQPWSTKCKWAKMCDGCSPCSSKWPLSGQQGKLVTGVGAVVIVYQTLPDLAHHLLFLHLWHTLLDRLTTTTTPESTATPATPDTVCKSWCGNHRQAWEVKCTWSNRCAGCLQCFGEFWSMLCTHNHAKPVSSF